MPTGDPFCMIRKIDIASLLTTAEQAEYDRLCAWWLTWTPPAEPYRLNQATVVSDPRRNQAYYAARIGENCRGEVQQSVFDHLRRCANLFGGA